MNSYIFSAKRDKEENKTVKKFFGYSLLTHSAVVLGIIIFTDLLDFKPRIELPAIEARIVRLGKDMKKLPRIDAVPIPTQKTSEKANTLNEDKKDKEDKNEKKLEKKKEKNINLDDILGKDFKEDKRADDKSEAGSPDGVEGGDVISEALAVKGSMYIRMLNQMIRQNWKIPGIIGKEKVASLSATFSCRVTFSGELYGLSIVKSSGDEVFDSSVMEAVKKTGKIPLPADKELRKFVLKEGIEWVFKPEI